MAKAKWHRRPKATLPLAIVGGFVPLAMFAYDGFQTGGITNAAGRVAQRLTGWDYSHNTFVYSELAKGWFPILGGIFAHTVAQRLGINRALAKAGVPLIRI